MRKSGTFTGRDIDEPANKRPSTWSEELTMGGAMAGSAICSAHSKANWLDMVTLTINNVCNLSCPHCYLEYDNHDSLIDWNDVQRVLASSFRHLCIVGKEPLANRASAALVTRIVEAAVNSGRSASLITNGLNLPFLDTETLSNLAWLDVSVDASPYSYGPYRGGSYAKLSRGIKYALRCGIDDLRILHTVSSANIEMLREMVSTAFDIGSRMVVISPFQITHAARDQRVAMVPPEELLRALGDTGFADDPRLRFILDVGYLRHFSGDDVVESATRMLGERFINVETDPIDRGIIRVTYDGLVLTPLESVHTADYPRFGRPLSRHNLSDWFRIIRDESNLSSPQPVVASCH
jgi:MoaA/NifB/PqqE/SkfB family radical SAM enzyme